MGSEPFERVVPKTGHFERVTGLLCAALLVGQTSVGRGDKELVEFDAAEAGRRDHLGAQLNLVDHFAC